MATLPAGTRTRGVARRGRTRLGASGPRYPNPGAKPRNSTRYVAEACRSMTSDGERPMRAATSGRSGPSSPPYRTGISTGGPTSGHTSSPGSSIAAMSPSARSTSGTPGSIGLTWTRTLAAAGTAAPDPEPGFTPGIDQRRSGTPDQRELGRAPAHGARDRPGDGRILGCPVVEGAMGLHVAELGAGRASEHRHGPDLVDDRGLEILGAHRHVPAAEPDEVGVARMRPDRCARGHGESHGLLNR